MTKEYTSKRCSSAKCSEYSQHLIGRCRSPWLVGWQVCNISAGKEVVFYDISEAELYFCVLFIYITNRKGRYELDITSSVVNSLLLENAIILPKGPL